MTPFGLRLLRTVGNGKTAYEIGKILWPKQDGRGSSGGGPSSCACAASWQIGRFQKRTAGKYIWTELPSIGLRIYKLTREGRILISERKTG